MTNQIKIALTTAAGAIAIIVFFLGLDTACLGSGTTSCRVLKGFQWESIIAGALGLAGGLFVIASTRQQIQAQREDAASLELVSVDKLLRRNDHMIEELGKYIAFVRAELANNGDTNRENFEMVWYKMRGLGQSIDLQNRIDTHPEYPNRLKIAARRASDQISHLGAISYPMGSAAIETVEKLEAIRNTAITMTNTLRAERNAYAKVLMRRRHHRSRIIILDCGLRWRGWLEMPVRPPAR